jgi:small subunit ribosomal protein S4
MVNGKRVNIPSYLVNVGDTVEVSEKSRKVQAIVDSLDAVIRRGLPQWIAVEKEKFKGEIKSFPVREDLTLPMQEQLIVELYSK